MHEWLISLIDAPRTVRRGDYYVICPDGGRYTAESYARDTGATRLPSDFEYISNKNDSWLSDEDIRSLVTSEVAQP